MTIILDLMKKAHILLLLSLVLTLSSCGAARYYAGFTPEAAKKGMVVLGPSSVQYYIDKQNKEAYDDSLSTASESLIATVLEELNLPVSQRVQLDSVQKEEAVAFMRFITAKDKKLRGVYPIPGLFDELLESKRPTLWVTHLCRRNESRYQRVCEGGSQGCPSRGGHRRFDDGDDVCLWNFSVLCFPYLCCYSGLGY